MHHFLLQPLLKQTTMSKQLYLYQRCVDFPVEYLILVLMENQSLEQLLRKMCLMHVVGFLVVLLVEGFVVVDLKMRKR